jgi:DNA-binding FadR family transcriptional regulator
MPKLRLGPVNRQRLHEAIADRLEQMILDGALNPAPLCPPKSS